MVKKPERVAQICLHNSQLNFLNQRAKQLDQLNFVLQQALPTQFVNHCQLANVTPDSIILHTDNANFASLIRFQAPMLCKTLSAYLPQSVTKLEVKVRTSLAQPSISKDSSPFLSDKAANTLQQTAALLEDGELKQALSNLAQRHKPT